MFRVDDLFELTERSDGGGGGGGEGEEERVFEAVDGEETTGDGVGTDYEEFEGVCSHVYRREEVAASCHCFWNKLVKGSK